MAKLLVVAGSAEPSSICDMMSIHHYMQDKTLKEYKYLTVADIAREKYYQGAGVDRRLIFDPNVDNKFWWKIEPDDLYDEAKACPSKFTGRGEGAERIVCVILPHGDPAGNIMLGSGLYPVSDFLQRWRLIHRRESQSSQGRAILQPIDGGIQSADSVPPKIILPPSHSDMGQPRLLRILWNEALATNVVDRFSLLM